MKALIQRVMKTSVSVGGEIVGNIDQGLCVLIGICNSDTHKDMEYILWRESYGAPAARMACRTHSGQYIDGVLYLKSYDPPADRMGVRVLRVRKILNVRLFDNAGGKRWCCNVMEKEYEIICISQFTLYNTLKGNKPDFHNAMPGESSKQFYEEFLEMLKKSYKSEKVKDGVFGAYMQVSIQNDGPVTIEIESPTAITVVKEAKTQ